MAGKQNNSDTTSEVFNPGFIDFHSGLFIRTDEYKLEYVEIENDPVIPGFLRIIKK
jgi:hypothetical protein